MAGKDFRLTAVLAIRDVASPVVKAFSARWVGLAKVVQSTKFTGLQKQLRLFNRSVMDVAENAKNLGSIVGGPLAAAAGSVGFSMQQAVSSFTATGDGLDKMSQRVGVGVERLQEWGYAAVQAGASQETLEDALKDFGKHMTEIATGMDTTSKAATLFDALGIKMKDAAGNMRSVEDVFRDFADAIQRNEDPTLRASMAMAVFGEGGRKLLPMLTAGAAGLDDMSAEAHRLGIVMSRDAVKSASDLSTGFTNLHLVVASVGNTIASSLAPTITHMTGRIQTMIVANREAFSEKFAQVAERFAQSLESIDFEGIVSGILAFADYAIRAFNAVGGFNTVLYTLGAIMAGKTIMAVVALGSSVMTMIQTFSTLATIARTVGVTMAGALGPVGFVISAVAIAAGLVIANWDRIWPAIKEGAQACVDFVAAAWDRLTDRFGAVGSSILSTAKAVFRGDFPAVLRSIDDVIKSVFNLLPDSWAKACTGWYESVKKSVQNVGRIIRDFFANFDFASLVPDFVKSWFSSDSKTSGSTQSATVQRVEPVNLTASQHVSGRVAVDVTATGGASAAITDAQGSGGLDILGSVGYADRYSY